MRWKTFWDEISAMDLDVDDFEGVTEAIIEQMRSRCGAETRQGHPCRRKKLANGRCRNHGGLSTGPRTEAGRARALQNLRQFRRG